MEYNEYDISDEYILSPDGFELITPPRVLICILTQLIIGYR